MSGCEWKIPVGEVKYTPPDTDIINMWIGGRVHIVVNKGGHLQLHCLGGIITKEMARIVGKALLDWSARA